MVDKTPEAFRTISEAAQELDVPQHVLRFWETKFSHVRPLKRGGGRRYYRPSDIDLLRGVRTLLYDEGYTIKGVQKLFREQGPRFVSTANSAGPTPLAMSAGEEVKPTAPAVANGEGAATALSAPVARAPEGPTAPSAQTAGRLKEVLGKLETAKQRLDRVLDAAAPSVSQPTAED